MAEKQPELTEVEHERFLAEAIIGNARNMARYSIGQTPSPDFPQEGATDLEVASYLSRVEVDDTKLSDEIKEGLDKNLTPDTLSQAASLAAAKAEAAKEVASPKQKGRLERLFQKIASQTSKLLQSGASRRAFLKAAPVLLGVLATSCGAVDTVVDLSWPTDVESPAATAEATEVVQPTETSTPTPEPWLIEELPWHWLGEWQRVETTNEETGETVGFNVRFAVSEGLPFEDIQFATAERIRLIYEDIPLWGADAEQRRADLETLLAENPDGWAQEAMARAISLALGGAEDYLNRQAAGNEALWQRFIEEVRTRGVVFLFQNDQVLGDTQERRQQASRGSSINYPPEEILPPDTILGYMERIPLAVGNSDLISRVWIGFLPDGTPCFYINARKRLREIDLQHVEPEEQDLVTGLFLTNQALAVLRHLNPAFVGDPPRFLMYEPGSEGYTNPVPYQELLSRIRGSVGMVGLSVPPGFQDPEITSLPFP